MTNKQGLPIVDTCPSCGSKRFKRVRRDWTGVYRRIGYRVSKLDFHECPDCGERAYSPAAMQRIQAASPAYAHRKHKRAA